VAKRLRAAREAFLDVVDFVAGNTKASPNAVFAGSVPYLMLAGNLVAGWQLGACPAGGPRADGRGTRTWPSCRPRLPRPVSTPTTSSVACPGLRDSIVEGADSVTELALEAF
jgi:hypothetical protein